MKNQTSNRATCTLQEWSSFLAILNGPASSDKPLLKKSDTAARLVYSLTKQFEK